MEENTNKKDWKTYLYPALAVVAAVAIIWGLSQFSGNRNTVVSPKGVELTDEQKKSLEDEAGNLQAQINSLPANPDPDEKYDLYVKLASVRYNLTQYPEAIAALDAVRDQHQNKPSMWQRYALVYKAMADPAKGREAAKRAVDLDKTIPGYWITYIELSADQGNDATKALYQQALTDTENNVGIVTAYAKFLETAGDKQGAIDQWRKASEIFPAGKTDYDQEIARLQV